MGVGDDGDIGRTGRMVGIPVVAYAPVAAIGVDPNDIAGAGQMGRGNECQRGQQDLYASLQERYFALGVNVSKSHGFVKAKHQKRECTIGK